MSSRRAVTVAVFVQLIALAVSAQQSSEWRASGGEVVLTTKNGAPFSGSLQLSLASGNDVFGRGSKPGYGITAGGTLIQDRLWFFGSASRQESFSTSRFANLQFPENATTTALGTRMNGQIAANQDFSAYFQNARRPEVFMNAAGNELYAANVPTSFLSLRYDALITNNMMFSASMSRTSRKAQGIGVVPVE